MFMPSSAVVLQKSIALFLSPTPFMEALKSHTYTQGETVGPAHSP